MDPEVLFERIVEASKSELFIRTANVGKSWRTDIFFAGLSLHHVRYSRERMFGQFYKESPIERQSMVCDKDTPIGYLTELIEQDRALHNWSNFWDSIHYQLVYRWPELSTSSRIPFGELSSLLNLAQCHGMLQYECQEDDLPEWNIILHRLEHIIERNVKEIRDSASLLAKLV